MSNFEIDLESLSGITVSGQYYAPTPGSDVEPPQPWHVDIDKVQHQGSDITELLEALDINWQAVKLAIHQFITQ